MPCEPHLRASLRAATRPQRDDNTQPTTGPSVQKSRAWRRRRRQSSLSCAKPTKPASPQRNISVTSSPAQKPPPAPSMTSTLHSSESRDALERVDQLVRGVDRERVVHLGSVQREPNDGRV